MNPAEDRDDLLQLQSEWRDEPRPPPLLHELRERARRGRRRLQVVAGCEYAIVVGAAAAIVYVLRRQRDAASLAWAIAVAVFCAAALGYAAWNRRGVWRPPAESCRDHLTLAELHCTRHARALRFGAWLLAVELAFLLPWFAWEFHSRRGDPGYSLPRLVVRDGFTLAVWIAGAFWVRHALRRVAREQAELAEMRREIDE